MRVVLAVSFVLIIGSPLVKTVVWPQDEEDLRKENRRPAVMPDRPLTAAEASAWPVAFEEWFNDFFGFRTQLIRWHNIVKLLVFRTSPSDTVDLGNRGWLFIGSPNYRASHRATHPYSEAELRRWKTVLEQRKAWLEGLGIAYVFTVAPNKSSIYPELMPDDLFRVGTETRLDQLVTYLAEHSDIDVLDLRPSLTAARPTSERVLYDPLGTHWNGLGAWIAYTDILNRLATIRPQLQPMPLERFDVVEGPLGESWAVRFHMEDLIARGTYRLERQGPPRVRKTSFRGDRQIVRRWLRERPGPAAVVLRDSFADALAPLLAPHFGTLDLIWSQTENPAWTVAFIEEQRPAVVIEEVVERSLMSRPAPFLRPGWRDD